MTNNRTATKENTKYSEDVQRPRLQNRPHNRPQNRSRRPAHKERQTRRAFCSKGSDLPAYNAIQHVTTSRRTPPDCNCERNNASDVFVSGIPLLYHPKEPCVDES